MGTLNVYQSTYYVIIDLKTISMDKLLSRFRFGSNGRMGLGFKIGVNMVVKCCLKFGNGPTIS